MKYRPYEELILGHPSTPNLLLSLSKLFVCRALAADEMARAEPISIGLQDHDANVVVGFGIVQAGFNVMNHG